MMTSRQAIHFYFCLFLFFLYLILFKILNTLKSVKKYFFLIIQIKRLIFMYGESMKKSKDTFHNCHYDDEITRTHIVKLKTRIFDYGYGCERHTKVVAYDQEDFSSAIDHCSNLVIHCIYMVTSNGHWPLDFSSHLT